MKLLNALVAVATALTLGGCYWAPSTPEGGGVSLSVVLPRGVIPYEYAGDFLRAYLYDAADVAGDITGDNMTPQMSGDPITIEGYDYYDVPLDQPSGSGSFVIPDIDIGRRYRLYVKWGYSYGGGSGLYFNYHGLSQEFEVPPGGVVDVSIDLYYLYLP